MLERFKQEVLLARKVSDPHVCRIHESGQCTLDGVGPLFYLTMEFIEGETLGARLRRSPALSLDAVRELSRQLLRGLAAAHAVGVLHRDFKSDNVMLRSAGARGRELDAVIMDFGLARLLDADAQRLTQGHELLGSAAYMAPEQLVEGAALSQATDVYAFGVVLFEMLTARLPFQAGSPLATALKRLTHDAPAPSSWVSGLPPLWDELVRRCLQREVERRFGSAAQVLAALDAPLPQHVTSTVLATAAATPVAAARRVRRRHALAIGALLTLAVGGAWWSRRAASSASSGTPPQSQVSAVLPAPAPLEASAVAQPPAEMQAVPPAPEPAREPERRTFTPARVPASGARAKSVSAPARAAARPAESSAAAPAASTQADDARDRFYLEPPDDPRKADQKTDP